MMEKLLSLLGLGFYLILAPLFLGGCVRVKEDSARTVSVYVWGMLLMMAVFQAAAVPLILLHRPLGELVVVWNAALVALMLFSMKMRRIPAGRSRGEPWKREEYLLLALVLLLFAAQCGAYVFGVHIDDDDARYVANAVAAYETNTMYRFHPNTGEPMTYFMGEIGKEVTSPLMIFYAAVSRVTGLHPTILIHTVWPVVWLALSFGVLILLAARLFPEKRGSRLLFLLFALLLEIWGNTSAYAGPTFLLTRLWQGKSLMPAVFAPLLFCLLLRRLGGEKQSWFLALLVCNTAACLCSGMGIYLSAIAAGCVVLAAAINERSFKTLIKGCLCCIPNVCYTGLYLLVHLVILR